MALVTRVGFLPGQEAQYPLIVGSVIDEGYQGYLQLVEGGRRAKQIIVVYPTNMERPKDKDRLIEIRGKLHTFKISKPSNTLHKRTHDSEAIEVQSWKYRD